jgi:RHS repeat-associated protein
VTEPDIENNIISVNLTASYTGYIYEETSNWWMAGARTYAPEIKRFTSADPLAGNVYEPDRIVEYTYAGNNPVVNVDRDGRSFASFCQTACKYVSKVWYAYNELMDKIPAPVKIAVGTAGAAIGVALGLPVATVAGAVAVGTIAGGMTSAAVYAVCNMDNLSWEGADSAFVSGAVDGYMWGGIGVAISGIGTAIKASKTGVNTVKVSENVYGESTLEGGTNSVSNKGYNSFKELKSDLGSPRDGNAWHHIVEQSQIGKSGFSSNQVNNVNNIISIPHGKGTVHAKISGYYSSKRPFTGGKTVREWLSGQSFQEQFDFGMSVLKEYGDVTPTKNGWIFTPFD